MTNYRNIRIFFKKSDRAVYISHLDLYRTFQRAFKRAGLPVWITEGFNKHVYLNFVLPLSLGVVGVSEPLDTKISEDISFSEIKDKLNLALPDGLEILNIKEPQMKATQIKYAEYEIISDIFADDFLEFMKLPEIITAKKTKKGIQNIDLKHHIKIAGVSEEKITLVLPTGTQFTINPILVFEAYKNLNQKNFTKLSITRTKIFNGKNEIFI